jgi:phage terminase small subunit
MAQGLTKKQERFVAEFCLSMDGKDAAIKARYSKKSAASQASQMLNNPKISAAIAKRTGKICEKLAISTESVLQGIAQLAHYDVRRFFDEKGNPKQIHELSDAEANAVSGFEFIELFEGDGDERHCFGHLKKFKIADRGQNLERLGRHLKLFTDKVELSGNIGLAERISEARKRECPQKTS